MDEVKQLASVEQFQVRLGRDVREDERPRVDAILQDTTAVALGTTDADWTVHTVPADVVAVILSAALRTFKNPDRYVQQAIGDYSARVATSELAAGVFTKAELDILQRNSQREGFTFGSFGTVEAERDERWGLRATYWATNRPGGPVPISYGEGAC